MYFSLLGPRRRRSVAAVAEQLLLQAATLAERWGGRTPGLSRRAAAQVARLFVAAPWALVVSGDFAGFEEHIDYTARRLAKLRVPLAAIGEGLLTQVRAAAPLLAASGPGEAAEAAAALDGLQHVVLLATVSAYDGVQRAALDALFGVLNAELEAAGFADLLARLLALASRTFAARCAGLLLANRDGGLAHAAVHGVDPAQVWAEVPVGRLFRRAWRGSRPVWIDDAANDPRLAQPYFRALEIKSVWAVPLRRHARGAGAVLGVLHLDFDRVYECLPQECDLLLAFARRSTLALERARLVESVRAGHADIRRLSRAVLRAQEDERRRIGRDLHDAAGQAFMAARLYLEMAQARVGAAPAAAPLRHALASVDAGIGGVRRVIRDLAPVGLKELGLAAALRQLARDFRRAQPIALSLRVRVPGRLPPEIEILAYRMAQEGLTNVARHARARRAALELRRARTHLSIRLSDDGVGLAQAPPPEASGGFGLAAMRERVALAGGTLEIAAAPGGGTMLAARLPLPAAPPPLALAAPA